jgi:hypothetical protein
MADLVKVEEKESYLYCIAEQFDYSIENLQTFIQSVLETCRDTGKTLVLIDFTAIREKTPATMKTLVGVLAAEQLRNFNRDVGRIPRIAALGVAPHVLSTYKPAQEILQGAGMPVAVFTEEATAKEWLFEKA